MKLDGLSKTQKKPAQGQNAMETIDKNSGGSNALLELTADVVAAYVSNNVVPASELSNLIADVHSALGRVGGSPVAEEPAENQKPADNPKKSVHDDFNICLEDGKKSKSLKRHLMTHYKLTPAASISVLTKDQAETDRLWTALLEGGGQESMCGWLEDRFGVSWQIVPEVLPMVINDANRAPGMCAQQAVMTMRKIDIAAIKAAFAGESLQ